MSKHLRLLLASVMLTFAVSQSAHAIMLRGDWESSGDLPISYVPPYSFEYRCQLEVTDHKQYLIEGEQRIVYAVSEIVLNSKKAFLNVSQINFVSVIRDQSRMKDRVVSVAVPFEIVGLNVALHFAPAVDPKRALEQDEVTLWASVGLRIGDQYVSDDDRRSFSRSDLRLQAKPVISSHTKDYSDGQSRTLFIDCEKIK